MMHPLAIAAYLMAPLGIQPAFPTGFQPTSVPIGQAIWMPRYREGPVMRVCGESITSAEGARSTEFPNGYGPNTFLLLPTKLFGGEGLFVKLRAPPSTSGAFCVTRVLPRTDGYSEETAARLRLYSGTFADVPDSVRMLHECNDQASCQALLRSVRREPKSRHTPPSSADIVVDPAFEPAPAPAPKRKTGARLRPR